MNTKRILFWNMIAMIFISAVGIWQIFRGRYDLAIMDFAIAGFNLFMRKTLKQNSND